MIIICCGSYSTNGSPGKWRRLKASGRATLATLKTVIKPSNVKQEQIYLSNCFFKPNPECLYLKLEEFAKTVLESYGIRVHFGTHHYS